MSELVLTTFDWVPEPPRGLVRDLRVRWALEEAGLPYRVTSVPFKDRGPGHFAHQPFGQVPFLTDGDLSIFESGAILLHIAEKSPKLMPVDAKGRSDVIKWLFAALNSVEMAALPQVLYKFTKDEQRTPGRELMDNFLALRLGHMEKVLTGRTWLTDAFSVADILMADVLRALDHFDGLATYLNCRAYVERATARPAFKRAYADQMAHFAKADEKWKLRPEFIGEGTRAGCGRSPSMHRDPVDSSSINSVGYDPERQILEVEFVDGDVYQYFDVPQQTYEAFVQAESLGQFMNWKIKEQHRYKRVE